MKYSENHCNALALTELFHLAVVIDRWFFYRPNITDPNWREKKKKTNGDYDDGDDDKREKKQQQRKSSKEYKW